MNPRRDAYGHGVWGYVKREGYEIIEREDGFLEPSSVAPKAYFAEFRQWPEAERRGIVHARGRVLDVGCGAGRVSLYLQRKRVDVLGIDSSPLTLKVAKARGVKKTRLLSFNDVDLLNRGLSTPW